MSKYLELIVQIELLLIQELSKQHPFTMQHRYI